MVQDEVKHDTPSRFSLLIRSNTLTKTRPRFPARLNHFQQTAVTASDIRINELSSHSVIFTFFKVVACLGVIPDFSLATAHLYFNRNKLSMGSVCCGLTKYNKINFERCVV